MIATSSRVQKAAFGRTRDGRDVASYTLQQVNGVRVEVLDYGAIVRCLYVHDRSGRSRDVVLGYDDIASYEEDTSYVGAAIGRYANRIRNGTFELDGKTYHLSINNGPNHLHGGASDFGKVMWNARSFDDGDAVGVVLEHASLDGEDGYPGKLDVQITYTLSASSSLSVDYRAISDRPTPVNLTQHSYFNLAGEGMGDVLSHEISINAQSFTEIDANLIPTGKLAHVEGTPLDFRRSQPIGARIEEISEQLHISRGYDHNFVLSPESRSLSPAARVYQPASGIVMEVHTTEPGMQFYSGNFLDGVRPGKHGHRYNFRSGFCLETQHFPDSPNRPEFPSTILRAGDELRSRTEYRFTTQ